MRLREPDVVWLSILWIGACSEEQPSSNKPPEESSHSEATHETSGRNPTEEQQPATRTDVVTSSSDDEASAAVNSEPVAESSPDAGVVVRAITGVGSRCDRAARIGALGVTLTSDRTIISGSVSNGTTPSSVPQVTAEAGGCQLLIPRSLFCTSCSVNETCAGDERCVAKPTKVSAGTLRVDGMLADVEVMPNGITLDYSKTVLDPYPAYEVGSNIEMRAAGDVVERFDGSLWGVSRLTTEQTVVSVRHGEAARLEWNTAGVDQEQSAVFVSFSVNVHGAVTGWIECTAPDTGEFEIPAELVSDLIDLGLSGFPRVDIERRSSATLDVSAGCVDLYVGSKVTMDIDVDGLQSCNNETDCAQGQTCSPELTCQ